MALKVPILRIPFDENDRQFLTDGLLEIVSSGQLAMGKYTREFEEMFARFVGARYAVSCSNGTSALELIIRALGIEGKSIIVPTNTFLATAFAVLNSRNKVIFADADPETLCLDPKDVEERIQPDTAAVLVVHIGGIITPAIRNLQDLCRSKNLYLIEDCAHAHGSKFDGQDAGTFGIAGGFSFFPTKVLVTGEGGMITTNDEKLADNARMIRNHGKNPARGNRMSEVGHNYRINEMAALMGVQQMRKADRLIEDRRKCASVYDESLKNMPGIRPLNLSSNLFSTYYKYIAYLDENMDRNTVKTMLKQEFDVSLTGEVYADLCHTEPVWERFTYCGVAKNNKSVACSKWPSCGCEKVENTFPGSDYISKHHVCLPVYPGLTDAELEHVVKSLTLVIEKVRKEQI
jgi:perosamine synthetase